MSQISIKQFASLLVRSKLVSKADVEIQYREHAKTGAKDANSFAKFLISSSLLTRYQAERLLAGRSEGFFHCGCKILGHLGQGGMGTVYLAEQTKLGRKVALKVLKTDRQADSQFVERFIREAKSVAELKHQHIVQIYDLQEDQQGNFSIVMELVEGPNLKKLLKNKTKFSDQEAVEIIKQTASGLQHAHRKGIVHRDIKPENLVVENSEVKILDLGLARKMESNETLTQDGTGLGTPAYMSPEQCADARHADARADLYSLGCTWFQLVTGKLPYTGQSAIGVAMAHAQQPTPHLSSEESSYCDLIAKLMEKRPEDRFQTADELLEAITFIHAGQTAEMPASPLFRDSAGIAEDRGTVTSNESSSDVSAAPLADSQSIVTSPESSTSAVILYIFPVMAALVLGGAYFGIQSVLNQQPVQIVHQPLSQPETKQVAEPSVASHVPATSPAKPSVKKAGPVSEEPLIPETAVDSSMPATQSSTTETPTTLNPPSTDSTEHKTEQFREPKIFEVMNSKELTTLLKTAANGDEFVLNGPGPFELPATEFEHDIVCRSSKIGKHPVILMDLKSRTADQHFSLKTNHVEFEDIAFVIDVQRAKSKAEIFLFDVDAGTLKFRNCSFTVVGEEELTSPPVTLVRLHGEPLQTKSSGLHVSDCFLRGLDTAALVHSRQADITFSNSIVALKNRFLHAFHTEPYQYSQHKWELKVVNSIIESRNTLISIDVRPFGLDTTPMHILFQENMLIAPADQAGTFSQVLWESPVTTEQLSTAIQWEGRENFLDRRLTGLRARNASQRIISLVTKADDWQKLGFGLELSPKPAPERKFPKRPLSERLISDYQSLDNSGIKLRGLPNPPRRFRLDK